MATTRREAARNASGCQRNEASKKYLSKCLLVVIAAILVYKVVLIESSSESQVEVDRDDSANSIDVEGSHQANAADGKSIKKPPTTETKQATTTKKDAAINSSASNTSKLVCEYDKSTSRWGDCELDGSQRKVMQLKSGASQDCKPTKTIRRDCEAVGCKYARGQWSSACVNGQRFRVDKLVGRIGSARSTTADNGKVHANDCKPIRRMTKDCRRTCHYIKSAWSECKNGFKTRLLTLDESMGGGGGSDTSLLRPESNDTTTISNGRSGSGSEVIASTASNEARVSPRPIEGALEFQQRPPEPTRKGAKVGGDGSSGVGLHKNKLESENSGASSSNHSLGSAESFRTAAIGPSDSTSSPSAALLSSRTCARHKLIRRECRRPGATSSALTTSLPSRLSTGQPSRPLAAPTNGLRSSQRLHSNANNLTPAQRRRLKQIQLKQQQQQQQEKQEKHEQQNTMKPDLASGSAVPTTNSIPAPAGHTPIGPDGGGRGTTASSASKKTSRSRR